MDVPRSFKWRPTTTVVLLGGFTLILIALVVSFMWDNFRPSTSVHIGSGVYQVWIADDEVERTKGLSGIESLSINGGLLMDFQQDGMWGIWMKDMKIPLDIIWMDKSKKVIYIRQNVSPDLGTTKTFEPKTPARYVLELPAGSVEKAGIRVGQQARFTVGGEQ